MNNANVYSVEALQQFSRDLQKFRLELLKELENLDLELRRLTHWITEECHGYWQREQQVARRTLAENQQQLSRCMSYVREEERRPCTEEKKRVARSKERLQLCEQKIQLSLAAANQWNSRAAKTMSKLQRCRDLGEADLMVAFNHLGNLLDKLESYAHLSSDVVSSAADSTSSEIQTKSPQPDSNASWSTSGLPLSNQSSDQNLKDGSSDETL